MFSRSLAFAIIAGAALTAGTAHARDQIRIAGSSTVFPYSQAVAEEFAYVTGNPAPVVESTGTGGGFKVFCQGIGTEQPDLTGASRAIKESEKQQCRQNGVVDVTEALFGYDGLSIAVSREGQVLDLTKGDLFQALAAEVPVDGEIVSNPYDTWNDIRDDLPDIEIQVFGPPPTSGTRDAFVELVMEEGCAAFDAVETLEEDRRAAVCQRMRQDGLFIEAGENDNLIVQRLESDPTAYGIFGYSFLYENQDRLQPVKVEGVEPTVDTIADGTYGISRPLFFYVKNAHRAVIPGLEDFLAEYVSEEAIGPEGYLTERGLVPLSEERREEVREAVLSAKQMAGF